MLREIVICDIDSILYPFAPLFMGWAKEKLGVDIPQPLDDWYGMFGALSQKEIDRALRHCFRDNTIRTNVPFEGAADALVRISQAGYDIRYYTDRDSSTREATEEWLAANHFPVPSNLRCCHDKRFEITRLRKGIATLIDDRPRTLVWARSELKLPKVYSLRYGYNKNLTDIPGIHLYDSWDEMAPDLHEHLGTEVAFS